MCCSRGFPAGQLLGRAAVRSRRRGRLGRVFRYRIRDQPGQLSGVEYAQLMQGAGRSHIEQFGMTVVRGVVFRRWIKDQYRVKFQSFGVVHRQHHDAVSEDCFLQVAFDAVQIEG